MEIIELTRLTAKHTAGLRVPVQRNMKHETVNCDATTKPVYSK